MDIYSTDPKEYRQAGPEDLVRLEPLDGCVAPIIERQKLDLLVRGVVKGGCIHVSGETGTAKTLTIRTLLLNPANFRAICAALEYPERPLHVYSCPVSRFDGPAELTFRRAIKDGCTCDEDSLLIEALKAEDGHAEEQYAAILLPELGRTHSEMIQSALVELINDSVLLDSERRLLRVPHVAWLADSNYSANQGGANYTLVSFDDALRRRFSTSIEMSHPTTEQECAILHTLVPEVTEEDVAAIVRLGSEIRSARREGGLSSVPPPTLYGYAEFLRARLDLPHVPVDVTAFATILGHCSNEDRAAAADLLSRTHGVAAVSEDEAEGGDVIGL